MASMRRLLKPLVYFFFFSLSVALQGKVLIISHHCAQPFFIELQAKTFAHFLKDDYEFVIFNDAKSPQIRREIVEECRKYGVRCIRISPEIHNQPYLRRERKEDYNIPSVRTANAVQYSLDLIGFNFPGIVCIIDSDMFPTKEFSIEEMMEGVDLRAVPQVRLGRHNERIDYIWNGLVLFDMRTLPNKRSINFNCGPIKGTMTDTGGYTYHYLKENAKNLRFKPLSHELLDRLAKWHSENILPSQYHHYIPLLEAGPPLNMEVIQEGLFFHYRGGGLWDVAHKQQTLQKNEFVQNFIRELCD